MVVDYAVADLRDSVRNSSPSERAAVVDLSDGSKVILEFEDVSCKTLEVYGKMSKNVEQRLATYARKASNCFGPVPVQETTALFDDAKSYKVVTM